MKSNAKGFTLAELLLAAAILTFVLTGLLLLFVNCIILNSTNRNLSIATSHAQYIMEGIRHTPFANIQADINNHVWDWDVAAITSLNLTPLDAEDIDTAAAGSNPLDVTVTVSWNDLHGIARSMQLRTLIADSQ